MQLYRVINWRFSDKTSRDIFLLDFVKISKHFKGFRSNPFSIEFSFYKSWYSFSFKRGLQVLNNVFNKLHFRVVLRFNTYFITLRPLNMKEQYKLVEVL